MFQKPEQPDISVCIPVYNTEPYLEQCLQSVASQNFEGSIEVLVLSDASPGRDEKKRTAEKIVKEFTKKRWLSLSKPHFRYLENSQNLALIETRRRLVNEAHGKYLFMLDSDDFLPQGALNSLYQTALANNADIVQGDIVALDSEGKTHVESTNEAHPYIGTLEGKEIFDQCFCNKKYRAFITAKLIKRDLYERAFREVPYIRVHMAEEVIQYFFIALFAKKYVGINTPVYSYRIGSGITVKQISNINEWEKVCSTASLITALYAWVEEKSHMDGKCPLEEKELNAIQQMAKAYCIDNVKQLHSNVVPELYEQAYSLLCDYWSEEAVKNTEAFLSKLS